MASFQSWGMRAGCSAGYVAGVAGCVVAGAEVSAGVDSIGTTALWTRDRRMGEMAAVAGARVTSA